MSKEVVVSSWCDGEHVMKQPASHANQEVSLRAGKRFTVDLCEDCYGRLVSPLETIVHEHGVPVKAAAPAKKLANGTGPFTCSECGFGAQSLSGLGLHSMRKHNMRLSEQASQK